MNHGLDEIFNAQDGLAPGFRQALLHGFSPPEDYRAFRDDVLRWHTVQMRLLSPQDGFPRNALMRNRLARFESHSERLLDLADWLDAMSMPQGTEARFAAAMEDLAKGDVVPWAAAR